LNEIDERHLVDHRLRVRHDDHRGDAARRGRLAGGFQRFAMLAAGFPGEHL
jgi:hypothetical protein